MKQPTYDELYGVSLDEYYDYLDEHINWRLGADVVVPQIVKCEIEMLQKNYDKYALRNHELDDNELYLAKQIRNLRDKKKKHYKRLLQWQRQKAITKTL